MPIIKLDNSEDKAYFIINIVDDKTKHTRKNKHVLYIPEQKKILSLAKSIGFILTQDRSRNTVNMNINIFYIPYINLNKSNYNKTYLIL